MSRGDSSAVNTIDSKTLQPAVRTDEAKTVAIGENGIAVDGESVTAYRRDTSDIFTKRLLCAERCHGVTFAEKIVGVAAVERFLDIGLEEKDGLAAGGRLVALHQTVEKTTVVGGDIFHVVQVFEPALDFERHNACIYHGCKMLRRIEIAKREQMTVL